ncbi:recombinase family protein [Microbaculum marinum]|uniref:Recombinase family protein n=1 Tax=Microbaculum marinum TaxID=1764581 RepID=A0AAW9RV20_9HYPH
MKHCFGYVRVSSHKQGEGVSLDAQKDAILRFAEGNDIAIVRWFEEQQTAAKSGRPVFNQMLKSLKAGRAAGVVMHKIDRSARNFFDWAKIGELADNGIDIHFATESLDFRSRGGRLAANIQMAVAEDYVRNLRSEVLKGQRGQLERGYYPFSAPIGYLNNGKGQLKTIDPVKGPLVKLAFELYGSGQHSLHSLRNEIARRGLAKPSGQPLPKGSVEALLRNPFYAGIIRIRKTGEVYEGAHEPLISTELFERVTTIKAGKSGKKVTRHNHLFRGLFACGRCARSMIPERQKGHVYYRCQFPDCRRNCIREDALSDGIVDVLAATPLTDQAIAQIDTKAKVWTRKFDRGAKTQTCALQLAHLDARLERLEDAAIDQIIDAGSFARRKQKLLLEKAALQNAAREDARFHDNPLTIRKFLERLKSLAVHYEFAEPAEKREIVQIATSNRSVQDKNVTVEPSKWLRDTHDALGVLSCAHHRATSRTFSVGTCEPRSTKSEEHALQRLADLARSPNVARLFGLFMDSYGKAAFGKHDCQDGRDRL